MKQLALLLLTGLSLSSVALGYTGFYDSSIIVYTNGGAGTFYDLSPTTGNPDFNGTNLGTFDSAVLGTALNLGGQSKSYKGSGTDVTGHVLDYRVYSGAPAGGLTALNYSFQWNTGDFGAPSGLNFAGDQQWGTDVQGAHGTLTQSSNLLSGLANGTYTLEVFHQVNTNGVDLLGSNTLEDNSGSRFTATFTVVPEPSRALLMMAGLLGCFLRRRR